MLRPRATVSDIQTLWKPFGSSAAPSFVGRCDCTRKRHRGMAALRVKRGLEAGFLARRVAAGSARLSPSSLRSAASAASRTFLEQRKHLSGSATTTFEYKPLFQYDATPRDDPTKVCVRACWRVIGRVHAAWLWRFLVATFGSWRSLRCASAKVHTTAVSYRPCRTSLVAHRP